mmetsp:Transcript_41171/g.87871  ORF Transcript_41171/g.87871 Transcript_41171/m.87871 type:complete len:234 (-) Transcript_41171:409-1110(-)
MRAAPTGAGCGRRRRRPRGMRSSRRSFPRTPTAAPPPSTTLRSSTTIHDLGSPTSRCRVTSSGRPSSCMAVTASSRSSGTRSSTRETFPRAGARSLGRRRWIASGGAGLSACMSATRRRSCSRGCPTTSRSCGGPRGANFAALLPSESNGSLTTSTPWMCPTSASSRHRAPPTRVVGAPALHWWHGASTPSSICGWMTRPPESAGPSRKRACSPSLGCQRRLSLLSPHSIGGK